jgi:putative endonuclease
MWIPACAGMTVMQTKHWRCHSRTLLAGIHYSPGRLKKRPNIKNNSILLEISIMKTYYIYLMASQKNGTLYLGVTNDLVRRVWQHKNDVNEGFTKKYRVHLLVWYEATTDAKVAIQREKQMKKWRRQWKVNLIEKENPNWCDLYDTLI